MYGVARGFNQSENFSSLWMQVLNTYNVYFSALYSLIMITCIVYKPVQTLFRVISLPASRWSHFSARCSLCAITPG